MVRKGMDEGPPRDGLKEIRDLLDEDEPDLGGEVDFNFLINNEESDEDYAYGNLESNNDEQEREGSTSQPCDSSANFCSSLQTGFDQVSFGFPEELCDGYLVQSSFQVQEQDIETHDHADLGEEIENSKNEVINQDFIETSQCELAETEDIIYKEVEEVSNNQIGRLSLSPPRSPKIIDSGCNKFEICHSDPCDLDTALQPSKSPVTNTMREKSVSPRNSPHSSSGKNGDFRKDRGRRGNRSVSKSKSRSPVRPRSSSTKRERRDRSRSPNSRHHSRRSPRRYSTSRRRSPPAPRGYHSGSRSGSDHRRTGLGRPGRNLFIAGFSFLTKESDLEEKFSRFGRVQDVRIVRDKRSGDSRGFGFLSLERDEEADAAIRALDKTEWNGRILLVEKSKSHN